ncbi:MAG: hypothetical protein P1U57_10060 [Oleibacter sp.]|nr:hypothetical protein [Thalassolituus sp.]
MTSNSHLRLGQLLLDSKKITADQLSSALQYQQTHNCRIGEALLELGVIDNTLLRRTLSRQRWLRPCAACIALMAPISMTYANDAGYDLWKSNTTQTSNNYNLAISNYSNNLTFETTSENTSNRSTQNMLETAWNLYKGEPEKGEWRYSISRPVELEAYTLDIRLFF